MKKKFEYSDTKGIVEFISQLKNKEHKKDTLKTSEF